MRELLVDCKLALRLYGRTPVSSLIAVVVLAVGIAFVSALLSLYADLLLKPYRGIEDSDGLVTIATTEWRLRFDFTERMSEEVTSLETVVGSGCPDSFSARRSRSSQSRGCAIISSGVRSHPRLSPSASLSR